MGMARWTSQYDIEILGTLQQRSYCSCESCFPFDGNTNVQRIFQKLQITLTDCQTLNEKLSLRFTVIRIFHTAPHLQLNKWSPEIERSGTLLRCITSVIAQLSQWALKKVQDFRMRHLHLSCQASKRIYIIRATHGTWCSCKADPTKIAESASLKLFSCPPASLKMLSRTLRGLPELQCLQYMTACDRINWNLMKEPYITKELCLCNEKSRYHLLCQ